MDFSQAKQKKEPKTMTIQVKKEPDKVIHVLVMTYLDIDSDQIDPIIACENIDSIIDYVRENFKDYTRYGNSAVWVCRPKKTESMNDDDWKMIRYDYKYMKVVSIRLMKTEGKP